MNKREKILLITVLALAFTLSAELIFGRAGGGGGHGGGGGGGGSRGLGRGNGSTDPTLFVIVIVIWGIYFATVSFILLMKSAGGERTAEKAFEEDKLWDIKKMRAHATDTFLKMQNVWMSRNIEKARGIVTKSLFENYRAELAVMKRNNEKNILEDISITDVKIISCEDHKDNSRDTFIAHISGTILDYTIHDRSGMILKNDNKDTEEFVDTYHFVREDNKWMLDHIDNEVDLFDLLSARNYKETS